MKRKELPLSGTGLLSPRALASTLYEKRLLSPRGDYSVDIADDFDTLALSFRNLGADRPHFPITTLAILALLVRRVAETGRFVELLLPSAYRGHRSSLQRLLGRLGFLDLFLDRADPWTARVTLHGTTPSVRQDENPAHMHYLPFRWFDCSWFNYDGQGSPYLHTPAVRGSFERTLADALVAQGFVDQEAIDLFVHVLFLEIAWNTVLHSSLQPGAGYGVVGAQVAASSPDPRAESSTPDLRTLHLCVADLGVGIPHTLKAYYDRSERRYEGDLDCSTPSAILRCAIDPESTSRPSNGFPDKAYQEGYRGLARVADAIRPSGRLVAGLISMLSAGGGLRLQGQELVVRPRADDSLQKTQLPGVQTTAELRVTRELTSRVAISGSVTQARPEIRLAASLVDPDALGLVEAPTLLSELDEPLAIFDLGYADVVRRGVDRFVKAARSRFPDSSLVFWNVRSASSQLQHLDEWLSAEPRSGRGPTLLVSGSGDALYARAGGRDELVQRLLKLEGNDDNPAGGALRRVSIPIDVYVQVNMLVNSQYLTAGFEHAGPDEGFFTGRIHLLSGRDVGRFFSLGRNATQKTQLLRWTSTCGAAVSRIVAGRGVTDGDILVLGLANSVRDILVHAWQDFSFPYAAYTLMTYDVPTSDELEAVIRDRGHVILVTDVVSNASLLRETARLVARLGKRVLGTVALVDARERPDDGLLKDSFFVQGARLPLSRDPGTRAGQEYWVDPVSSVPAPTKVFGGHSDKRIEETLSLLSDTRAVRCGHIVDGQRHMSSYVDVRALLEERAEWLEGRVRAECGLRLASRGWTDFSPTLILHPSGIARVEAVHDPVGAYGTLTVYQTGVRQYLPLLRRIWPAAEPVEVPRAFDPGGRPRCARSLEAPGLSTRPSRDVVIADDCLWTGRASSQLAQIAISLGAERILVVPLLARMHAQDLQQFERLRSLATDGGAGVCEICYVCPLVLPIPHYNVSDCPYEATIQKFSRWTGRSTALEQEEALARADLAGKPPTAVPLRDQSYTAAWIRFRSYAELASDDEDALERLTHDLEGVEAPALLALLTLFLEDWGLLGRARLRQTVRPILRKIATSVLSSDAVSSAELLVACSLLRSLYPDEFVLALPAISQRMVLRPDIALLGRVVLQVSSLPLALRSSHETIAFLEQVTSAKDVNAKSAAAEDGGRLLGLLTVCRQLLVATFPVPSTEAREPPEAAREILQLLEQSEVITHQARSLIEIVAERGDDVKEYTAETLLRFYARWEEYYRDLFQSRLLPLLASLEATLLLTLSRASHLATPTVDYFTDLGSPYGPVNEDLIAFGYALRQLAEDAGSVVARKALTFTSKRLRDNILAKDSRLLRTLHAMRGPTIKEFLAAVESEIRVATVTDPPISVSVDGLDVLGRARTLFCPTEIARGAYLAIVENIRSHAFDPTPAKAPQVLVFVHASESSPETAVIFSFLNNGKPLKAPGPESHASRRAAADLRHFGGTLSPPAVSRLHDWTVEQAIELRLW